MKKLLRKTILFGCLLSAFVLAEDSLQQLQAESGPISNLPSSISCVVTASDYANFLNHFIPAKEGNQDNLNLDFLYDKKMGTDPKAACIIRLGIPGNFHYEVIAGRENVPITYLNQQSAERYAAWANAATTATSLDPTLKSNSNELFLERETPSLSMMQPGDMEAGSEAVDVVETMVAALSGVALGEMATASEQENAIASSTHPNELEEQPPHSTVEVLTLDTLRTASERYPEVMHWTIDEHEALQASEENDVEKNMTIVHRLNHLLKEKYSPAIARQMLLLSGHHENLIDPLSSSHLQRIFSKIDRIENERREIKKFFRKIIQNHQDHSYATADEEWKKPSAAWREQAYWDYRSKTLTQQRITAEELLKAAQEKRDEINHKENVLGKAAAGLKKIAPPLDRLGSLLPFPMPAGSVVEWLGRFFESLNEYITNYDVTKAEENLDRIADEEANFLQREAVARKEAHSGDQTAWKVEKARRKEIDVSIKKFAEALKPPASNLNIAAWNDWAKGITERTESLEPLSLDYLVEAGMNDPVWMEKMISTLWQEGIGLMKAKVTYLKTEQYSPLHATQGEERDLHQCALQATQKIAATQTRLAASQEAVEKTMNVCIEAENEYQKSREALRVASSSRSKREDDSTIYLQKYERAQRLLRKKQEELLEAVQEAAAAEAEGWPVFQKQSVFKKKTERAIERAQTQLAAWRDTLKKIWPELGQSFLESKSLCLAKKKGEPIVPPLVYYEVAERLSRKFARELQEDEAEKLSQEKPLQVKDDTTNAEATAAPIEKASSLQRSFYQVPDLDELGREDDQRLDDLERINGIIAARHRAQKEEREFSETGTISEATESSTITGSTFSKKLKATEDQEKLAQSDLQAAIKQWKELVKVRAKTLELANHPEEIFDDEKIDWQGWQSLDQRAVDIRKEKKRQARATLLAAKMEQESRRWEALRVAEAADEELKQLEDKMRQEEEKVTVTWQRLEFKNTGEEKNSETQSLSEAIKQAKTKASEAWQAWHRLTEEHPTVAILERVDEASIKEAQEKLKVLDRAANEIHAQLILNEKVRNNQDSAKKQLEAGYEPSEYSIAKPSKRRRFEMKQYQKELLQKQKEARDKFYQNATRSEKEALKIYQQEIEQAALEGARSNSLVAHAVWSNLIDQSVKHFRSFETRQIEGAIDHARALTEADWKAMQLFKNELQRVHFIKEKFYTDQESKEHSLSRESENAAQYYFNGDDLLWRRLTQDERARYNEAVEVANKKYLAQKLDCFEGGAETVISQNPEEHLTLVREPLRLVTVQSKIPTFTWKRKVKKAKKDVDKVKACEEQVNRAQQTARKNFIAAGELRYYAQSPINNEIIEELLDRAIKLFEAAGTNFEKEADEASALKDEFFLLSSLRNKIACSFEDAAEKYEMAITSLFNGETDHISWLLDSALQSSQGGKELSELLKEVISFSSWCKSCSVESNDIYFRDECLTDVKTKKNSERSYLELLYSKKVCAQKIADIAKAQLESARASQYSLAWSELANESRKATVAWNDFVKLSEGVLAHLSKGYQVFWQRDINEAKENIDYWAACEADAWKNFLNESKKESENFEAEIIRARIADEVSFIDYIYERASEFADAASYPWKSIWKWVDKSYGVTEEKIEIPTQSINPKISYHFVAKRCAAWCRQGRRRIVTKTCIDIPSEEQFETDAL